MTHDEAAKILEDASAKLMEHFDSIQILGSWMEGSATCFLPRGGGNFYARQHMAQEFVEREKSSDIADQIAKRMKDDD